MQTSYNRIAGTSVERVAALSDGIFGVAMTLLLLDVHVPDAGIIHSDADLWRALGQLTPQLCVYLMSFITLGIFWVGQQTQLNNLERSERHLTWIHLAFLFLVTLMPVSTRLLTNFVEYRAALIVYWLNILLFGLLLLAAWGRARRAGVIREDLPVEQENAICRRITTAQAIYAAGASLCLISTYLSIAVIVLVQLNYALAIFPDALRKKRG